MPPRSGTVGFRRARERRCAEAGRGEDCARTRRQSSSRKGAAVEWGLRTCGGLNRLMYRPGSGSQVGREPGYRTDIRKTGRIITEENAKFVPAAALEAWQHAVDEYEALIEDQETEPQ